MKFSPWFAIGAALLVAAGCGGGGGGASTTGGGTSQAVRVFATDDMTTAYDHVWVTVKQVSLVGASGNKVLFDDATGVAVDLKTLRDATGRRFRLLTNRSIPSGQYSAIQVTLASGLTVFPSGATTGTAATFDGATGDTTTLSASFGAPQSLVPGANVIVDFDLKNWTLTGNVVSATNGQFLRIVQDATIGDPGRHENDDYSGVVTGLSGQTPVQTFTISRGGATLNVVTDANTAIFNEDGSASPSLANGERVEVTGAFSTSQNAIVATSIKIENEAEHGNEVHGQVTDSSAANKTLTVTLLRCGGFVPQTTTVHVQVTDSTTFFSRRGVTLTADEFFAAVQNGGFVEAEGTTTGDTFTATRIKLDDGEHGGGHEGGGNGNPGGHDNRAEVAGTTSNANTAAGTFTVNVSSWEGLLLGPNAHLTVALNAGTEIRVNGTKVDAAGFFAALQATTVVHVEGNYDPSTQVLTATEVNVGPGGEGHGGGGGGGHDD